MDPSHPTALSHARLWATIDQLAARNSLTPSALARKAGLSATTFNRSKRIGPDGRPRWPSMESVSKLLDATGASLEEFFDLLKSAEPGDPLPPVRSVPIIGSAKAGQPGFFDAEGLPVGTGWDWVEFPASPRETLYALEVVDDEFAPLYRNGSVIVVSPEAEYRRGDRVLLRPRSGGVQARVLASVTASSLEFEPLDGSGPTRLPRRDILWVGRIVWASQ